VNSLRFRLILGFALVAIVPLAVAMAVLDRDIRRTVRAQAEDRLDAALDILRTQLRLDGERLGEKLALLARDGELKRLYLVEAATSAELRQHLAGQRFLLDLDYLWVADTSGHVAADGAMAAPGGGHTGRAPIAADALGPVAGEGLRILEIATPRALALDASAPILYREQRVGQVRGGVLLDEALLERLARTSGVELALHDARGGEIAETLAGAGGVTGLSGGADSMGNAALAAAEPSRLARRVSLGGHSFLVRSMPLALGPEPHARISGFVSTAAADATLAALRTTALLLALLGLCIATLLGTLWSRQISRPVERLASFSDRISRGEWDEPLAMESMRELQTLVAALERMRGDLRAYRDRLTAGERQAAYGQMARKVAHEIKNPLTPIAISIADLKRSFDQQRPDFPQILDQAVRTIGEEVQTLKHLIQEFSDFGRFPAPSFAAFDPKELLADLGALHAHETGEGRLRIDAPASAPALTADRAQLRQALLNLVQNGLDASAPSGRVDLGLRADGGMLEFTVADSGEGLSREQQAQLFVPGFTTKPAGSGLGLTIVERIVTDHRGTIAVESAPGRGTTFRIRLPLNPGA
jgi:nitrogen fixation/metabolism regulation signal transduction histidine kinase